jgi:choline-glycine betaine transporter
MLLTILSIICQEYKYDGVFLKILDIFAVFGYFFGLLTSLSVTADIAKDLQI